MQHNFGDRHAFNKHVGDVDEKGRRVKRQFSYYPQAEPPVLVDEGGAVGEEAKQAESLDADGNVIITAETKAQPYAFWWQATQKERTIFDEVNAGVREPYPTVDGLPPESDNHDINPGEQQPEEEPDIPFKSTMPPVTEAGPNGQDIPPFQQQHPSNANPTIPMDIMSFTEMQRQLILGQIEPLVELQDMVIQTQAILLSELLEPDSPHHRIMEMWMSKLENMRKTDEPPGNGPEETP